MTTLYFILCTIGAGLIFKAGKWIGKQLKRQRIAQEEAQKAIERYERRE